MGVQDRFEFGAVAIKACLLTHAAKRGVTTRAGFFNLVMAGGCLPWQKGALLVGEHLGAEKPGNEDCRKKPHIPAPCHALNNMTYTFDQATPAVSGDRPGRGGKGRSRLFHDPLFSDRLRKDRTRFVAQTRNARLGEPRTPFPDRADAESATSTRPARDTASLIAKVATCRGGRRNSRVGLFRT